MSRAKKSLAASIDKLINLDGVIKTRRDRYIFCYHRVVTAEQARQEGIHPSLWISPERFSSHIEWMKNIGEITDYHRILEDNQTKKPLFALTFDDGWKDNYTNAFPIIKKQDVPALIFIATDAVETGSIFWTEDIAIKSKRQLIALGLAKARSSLIACFSEAKKWRIANEQSFLAATQMWIEKLKTVATHERDNFIASYYSLLGVESSPLQGYILNWSEIEDMSSFNISFGSHTHKHVILENAQPNQIEEELKLSKKVLAERLQFDIDAFCYPNGRYSGKEGELLADSGFEYGFCLDNQPLSCRRNNHYIPRFLVSEQKVNDAACLKLSLLQVPLFKSRPHRSSVERHEDR
ncbi:polysaccharide deacetylase family protein [Geomonas agri]|uniref:polysaccharide deacetylase family protein n=1 Tax=Geomonas agri TaxID=2873702 RepID=UPI001CD62D57|nr:polysaccharide deacetylase family protein [Geomonas agri]